MNHRITHFCKILLKPFGTTVGFLIPIHKSIDFILSDFRKEQLKDDNTRGEVFAGVGVEAMKSNLEARLLSGKVKKLVIRSSVVFHFRAVHSFRLNVLRPFRLNA